MKQSAPVIVTLIAVLCLALAGHAETPVEDVKPVTTCFDDQVRDQDDMCIWRHPTDAAQSVIITADKYAHKLFVYDLDGKTLQIVPTFMPGNIDIRSGFPLGDKKVDLVVFCERRPGRFKLRAYTVDPETRQINQVDNDAINTGPNYGGAMYHSLVTGKFFFFTTARRRMRLSPRSTRCTPTRPTA